MAATYGLFVSNEDKNVLTASPRDLSFGSDANMYKIKQEKFAQSGETLNIDHGLNYFPFFLAYDYNTTIADGRALAIATGSEVNVWSAQTKAYIFVAYNPGVSGA